MIIDKLTEAEAKRRGITVSEEEITEHINRFLASQVGGLTAAAASATSTARVNASATAAVWTPTPTFTPSPTLTTTEEITQPTATPINTSTPAPTPTFNVIDENTLTTQYTNWLNTLAEQAATDIAHYRQFMRLTVLRDKLGEALGREVPTSAEHAHARHILVETEEEIKEVIERLQAGEDFADIAEEVSIDRGSAVDGGDLGFSPPGRYVPSIDDAVFTLPIGQISEPISSQFGWHVIEVLEREVRDLSPADYSQSQRLAFSNWLEGVREMAEIEDFWSSDKAPVDPFFEQR
jgi:parvulin-like peptidyl-prolyl isomerase